MIFFSGDRPRVKNYYRNAQVSFWTGLVPQLHASGREGVPVPEEHNFLPDHFKRDSFFGTVRSYASYANEPFPPPPLPPVPLPKAIEKLTTEKTDQQRTSPSSDDAAATTVPSIKATQNSSMLSVTVAVGCGLLILNICIGLGLYKQCNRREETKKKLQLQYQTYAASDQSVGCDANYLGSVTAGRQLGHIPAGSSSTPTSLSAQQRAWLQAPGTVTDAPSGVVTRSDYEPTQTHFTYQNYEPTANNSTLTKLNFHEQEPLLSAPNRTSIGSLPRSGVSPTCPRHGRAAMAQVSATRMSLLSSSTGSHALEEIQV